MPSSRRARGPVKVAGMCCTTTIGQGKSAGSGVSRASSAGGPPVDVPTSTRPSPVALSGARSGAGLGAARTGRGLRVAAPMRWRTFSARRRLGRSLAPAAARTVRTSSGAMSWMPSDTAPSGLGMKSTAPRRRAFSVASAPSAVREETITTGQGRSTMIRSRHSRPSIWGMCTSRVTTSGA